MRGKVAAILLCCLFLQAVNCGRVKRGFAEPLDLPSALVTVREVTSDNGMTVQCGTDVIISFNATFVSSFNLNDIQNYAFLNATGHQIPSCVWPAASGAQTFNLSETFAQCAASLQEIGSTIVVNYTICVIPKHSSAIIARAPSITVSAACVYQKTVTVSSTDFTPIISKIRVQAAASNGTFDVIMQRYDSGYVAINTNHSIYVPEPFYIGIEIVGGDNSQLILQLMDCWATPSPNASDPIRYSIVKDWCADTSTVMQQNNMVTMNFQSAMARFNFDSFVWTNLVDESIFLHCKASICPDSEPSFNCQTSQSCVKKRKRSVTSDDRLDVHSLSLGPFVIKKLKETCDKEDMGCEHDCAVSDESGESYCVCPPHFFLASDAKSCQAEKDQVEIEDGYPQQLIYVIKKTSADSGMLTWVVVVCACVLLAAMAMKRSLKQKISKKVEAGIKL